MVGAVDNDGKEAVFSQGGPLVDVWAPAVRITVRLYIEYYKNSLSFYQIAAPKTRGPVSYIASARVNFFFESRLPSSSLKPSSQCAYGAEDGTTVRSGTSYAAPQVAALAAILMVAHDIDTASQVKEKIVGLAHSRNGGPKAIYVGNPGAYCQSPQKRGTRRDAKRAVQSPDGISACEIESLGTATGATASATSRAAVSSSMASTTPSSILAK